MGDAKNLSLDSTSGALLGGGSPKTLYTFFLLNLCKQYFEVMLQTELKPNNIDASTYALVSFCLNREKRESLWKMYEELREEDRRNTMFASTRTVGELMSYLSETLELEEEAVGGLF